MNEITVLDKGYVKFVSSSNNEKTLQPLKEDIKLLGTNDELSDICTVTLIIRCPLFLQLHLSKFNLVMKPIQDDLLNAYVPNESVIGASLLEDSKTISNDMFRTTEALLINPRAYQKDGCDVFISQVLSPINIYTKLLISGNLVEWSRFLSQTNLPYPIEQYRKVIENIVIAEWPNTYVKN